MGIRVAVAGASGYAGGELLRLIAGHPHLELATATGFAQAGSTIATVHPHVRSFRDVVLAPTGPEALADADLVFLALPHGESAALAAQLPESVKVVDIGADFRLRSAAEWEQYYSGPHAGTWTYGLPELPGQRERIAASTRVANTGCYAVTTILALAPLIAAGVADPEDVVVVAASGTSGAGRSAKQHLLASEVMGSMSPYKVGAHQHVPEIKQASGARTLSMTPILAPMPRGILATVTARALTGADPREVLAAAYDGEPFVHVLPAGQWPQTGATLGSNSAHLQATVDVDSGRIVVVSATDNLVKGAAGQAVQNANIMLGLPEVAGLAVDGIAP
ncbi:N-acetyl-gamma-glutamyl-phosphate reductase [Dactylosporangium matsuzakiense]|uniref:N-acetyl-gamma-glutamyl-phosphate reductase n=1 Tax=Dactylosporangium matsuzakiense TaxID=53360 RepID=A0A9W6KLD0_9ACTN|nr:N-acetyl-gamma-glutamyl-phosphate reductase [Dactylosporangium matsuzakiense]UWZ42982.1 N-acetyl-gamma-glutamyl-phosphate reductase [Dactylosporangium matsuzakiense]GLL03303.1 N-acetyl-gamma-glutamyl-phosphate reductase [Dactylosporangium matsuzakiense]